MTIILPAGISRAWAAAHLAASVGEWNDLAHNLLLEAADEKSHTVRGDILTLALVACQHGFDRLHHLDRLLRRLDEDAGEYCAVEARAAA